MIHRIYENFNLRNSFPFSKYPFDIHSQNYSQIPLDHHLYWRWSVREGRARNPRKYFINVRPVLPAPRNINQNKFKNALLLLFCGFNRGSFAISRRRNFYERFSFARNCVRQRGNVLINRETSRQEAHVSRAEQPPKGKLVEFALETVEKSNKVQAEVARNLLCMNIMQYFKFLTQHREIR